MRTTGAGFSCRRRDDHHSSVPADHPRPLLNALAVFPLARQLATRFFQIAALSDMDPRSSGTHGRTQRRGRYTGYPDGAWPEQLGALLSRLHAIPPGQIGLEPVGTDT